ncbi:MAG: hypothetical protein AAF628_31320 [Planctomycetota bacterium]
MTQRESKTTGSEAQRRLEAQLRRDAAAWGGEPVSDPADAFLAQWERPQPAVRARPWRSRRVATAASLAVIALMAWAFVQPRSPASGELGADTAAAAHPHRATLRRELSALTADAGAVADSLWQGMPGTLRRLWWD